MSFGHFERGDTMDIRVYSGIYKIIGTREPSYFLDIDHELTLNPDGTISGGSVDWSVLANAAYLSTFGYASDLSARDAATNFSASAVVSTGSSTLQFGPYGGQATFTFATKYMNDGSFWFDLNQNGTYETHGTDVGSGLALDLDFNGSYETPMIDFFS